MRKLASALDDKVMSLGNHVGDKGEVRGMHA
jgi:hypothetical protein